MKRKLGGMLRVNVLSGVLLAALTTMGLRALAVETRAIGTKVPSGQSGVGQLFSLEPHPAMIGVVTVVPRIPAKRVVPFNKFFPTPKTALTTTVKAPQALPKVHLVAQSGETSAVKIPNKVVAYTTFQAAVPSVKAGEVLMLTGEEISLSSDLTLANRISLVGQKNTLVKVFDRTLTFDGGTIQNVTFVLRGTGRIVLRGSGEAWGVTVRGSDSEKVSLKDRISRFLVTDAIAGGSCPTNGGAGLLVDGSWSIEGGEAIEGQNTGIWINPGARLEADNIRVRNNCTGIVVDGGALELSNSIVEKNEHLEVGFGVGGANRAQIEIVNSEIKKNKIAGVSAQSGSNAVIRSSVLTANGRFGVDARGASSVTVEATTIATQNIGAAATEGSALNITGSTILQSTVDDTLDISGHGVAVINNSDLVMTDTRIMDSARFGVFLYAGAVAQLSENRIRENNVGGLLVVDSFVTLSRDHLDNSLNRRGQGIAVADNSWVMAKRVWIRDFDIGVIYTKTSPQVTGEPGGNWSSNQIADNRIGVVVAAGRPGFDGENSSPGSGIRQPSSIPDQQEYRVGHNGIRNSEDCGFLNAGGGGDGCYELCTNGFSDYPPATGAAEVEGNLLTCSGGLDIANYEGNGSCAVGECPAGEKAE